MRFDRPLLKYGNSVAITIPSWVVKNFALKPKQKALASIEATDGEIVITLVVKVKKATV